MVVIVRRMKDKCKDAARMRREKERAEFVELSKLLPLPSSTTSQLDKASIIRLTSSYLRFRAAFPKGLGENWGTTSRRHIATQQQRKETTVVIEAQQRQPIRELGSLILQTLDGFAFALHKDGKIMYISETASVHLGLPQIDLTGSSIFEYIHPSDCSDLSELFSITEGDRLQLDLMKTMSGNTDSEASCGASSFGGDLFEVGRTFCMRMKCILPKRNAGLASNGYKTIHCSGYLKVRRRIQCGQQGATVGEINNHHQHQNNGQHESQISGHNKSISQAAANHQLVDLQVDLPKWEGYALVAIGHSLLPTASTEVKLGANSFMFRASLDLNLHFIEPSIMKLLGYEQSEIIGHSLYQFVHAEDAGHLAEAHRLLLNKGQVVTRYYRLVCRNGGLIWLETHAALVNNPRSMPRPQHIVGVCYVIGHNQQDQSRLLSQQHLQSSSTNKQPPPIRSRLEVAGGGGDDHGGGSSVICDPMIVHTDNARKSLALSTASISSSINNIDPELGRVLKTVDKVRQSKKTTKVKRTAGVALRSRKFSSSYSSSSSSLSSSVNCKGESFASTRPMNKIKHNIHPSGTQIIRKPASIRLSPSFGQNELASYSTIGSTRRHSDDSSSIVSSVTSTSVSSSSDTPISLHNYAHQIVSDPPPLTSIDQRAVYATEGQDVNNNSNLNVGYSTSIESLSDTAGSRLVSSFELAACPQQQIAGWLIPSTTAVTNDNNNNNCENSMLTHHEPPPIAVSNGSSTADNHQFDANCTYAPAAPTPTTTIASHLDKQPNQLDHHQLLPYNSVSPPCSSGSWQPIQHFNAPPTSAHSGPQFANYSNSEEFVYFHQPPPPPPPPPLPSHHHQPSSSSINYYHYHHQDAQRLTDAPQLATTVASTGDRDDSFHHFEVETIDLPPNHNLNHCHQHNYANSQQQLANHHAHHYQHHASCLGDWYQMQAS